MIDILCPYCNKRIKSSDIDYEGLINTCHECGDDLKKEIPLILESKQNTDPSKYEMVGRIYTYCFKTHCDNCILDDCILGSISEVYDWDIRKIKYVYDAINRT